MSVLRVAWVTIAQAVLALKRLQEEPDVLEMLHQALEQDSSKYARPSLVVCVCERERDNECRRRESVSGKKLVIISV